MKSGKKGTTPSWLYRLDLTLASAGFLSALAVLVTQSVIAEVAVGVTASAFAITTAVGRRVTCLSK